MSTLLERTGTFVYSGCVGWDIHDTLGSICVWLQPESYLEVGVDGGMSLQTVLKYAPGIKRVVLCDIWNPAYCHHRLTGHRHVSRLLDKLGYRGSVEFLDGSSHLLLPAVPKGVTFDLITVDGDHTAAGARQDLTNCWAHLNVGGVLVFDDVNHADYPWLPAVAEEFAREHESDAFQLCELTGRTCNTTAFRKTPNADHLWKP